MTHSATDYSGGEFGAPSPSLLSKSWRLKHGLSFGARAVGATLLGQDSVGVTAMSRGLAVYGGYEAGTLGYARGGYTTMPEVYRVWPGKKYLSVGRDAIDIEPGLASPGDAPGFVRGARPQHTPKPVVYCSAGDLTTVIGHLNAAGIPRSAYFIWSAHWIGRHICGPGTCGYPQADGTQYGSNNSFDSDIFAAYMFGPVTPPADPSFPLRSGDRDVTANGPVHVLQTRLNAWRPVLKTPVILAVNGDFGASTRTAVIRAQEHFDQHGVTAGICTKDIYNRLLLAPPLPVPGPTPTPTPAPGPAPLPVGPPVTELKVLGAGQHSVKFEFTSSSLPSPASFDVVVAEDAGGKFGKVIDRREIQYAAPGHYGPDQYGSLEPGRKYILAVRTVATGHAASEWAKVPFETAK